AGIHAAGRLAHHTRFGKAYVVSQQQANPQVTVGPGGDATAAWTSEAHGSWTVGASGAAAGKHFGDAASLKIPGLGDAKPSIGVEGRRARRAAWSDRGRVVAATCHSYGRCGRARPLSPVGEQARDPQVAVAVDGTAVVAWESPDGVSAAVRRGHETFR